MATTAPDALLAGCGAGALGGLAALAFMLLDGAVRGEGWLSVVNLAAAGIFPSAARSASLSVATWAGGSVTVLTGAAVGVLATPLLAPLGRRPGLCRLVAMIVAIGWYVLSFRLLWPELNGQLVLNQPLPGMLFVHVIFGVGLGLYPDLIPRPKPAPRGPFYLPPIRQESAAPPPPPESSRHPGVD